jgi:hypothetical protein
MIEQELVEPKVFQCSLCPFYAAYDRHDSTYIDESIPTTSASSSTSNSKTKKQPPLTIDLLEKVYLLRDPFVAVKEADKEDQSKISSLIIGATCSVCSCAICVHVDCSLFYTRRFCLRCVARYREEFPREVLEEIGDKRLEKFYQEEYDQLDER